MGANDPNAVIGVYTTANRQTVRMFDPTTGVTTATGPYDQVSRLGNPLVNEVVVPMASKDYFNSQPPVKDSQFAAAVEHPELQNLLPVLYPGAFPNLAAYTKARADLVAIFATGIPGSVIGSAFGVGTYQGGKVIAEMLRLNMGIAPTSSDGTQTGTSNLGLLGNDLAGFPNGRRPTDDVVTIAVDGGRRRHHPVGRQDLHGRTRTCRWSTRGSRRAPAPTRLAFRIWPTRMVASPTRRPRRRTTPTQSSRRRGT